MLLWIKDFLRDQSQQVVLNGSASESLTVSSRVPQGSVMGPVLFLLYFNDIPEQVEVCLLTIPRSIPLLKHADSRRLQTDLNSLVKWAKD